MTALETGDRGGTCVRLVVEDDGVGVSPDAAPGNGLTNIGERARRLGGHAVVQERQGGGTRLDWTVPFSRGTAG